MLELEGDRLMDKNLVDEVLIIIRDGTDETAKKLAVASLLGLIQDDFLKYTRSHQYRLTYDEEWDALFMALDKIVRSIRLYDSKRQSSTGWITKIFQSALIDFLRKKRSRGKGFTTAELTDEIFEELIEAPLPLDTTGRIKRRKKPRKPKYYPDVPREDAEEFITSVLRREEFRTERLEASLPEAHAIWTERREALQQALRRAHPSDLETILDPGSRFGPAITEKQEQALERIQKLYEKIYHD
jgi:hypothetical protein